MASDTPPPVSAEDYAAQDTGGRHPVGWQSRLIPITAFVWACFQLYIASNLPFALTELTGIRLVFTEADVRLIHLAFALFLAAMAFPLLKTSPRHVVPWYDWLLAGLAVAACLYGVILRESIAERAGIPTTGDLVVSTLGLVILASAVYRTLGLPLAIIAGLFLLYVFFGSSSWLPDVARWKGASYSKAMWHYWMQNEGVFGVALGVSARLIFLFVLFGAILEKAGAGNYFIKLAFALLGHFRGGPAKAAVMASAMSGLYSGSSIANTVTTGTFTIPLMKRTGFTPEKAGAVEVASSTNGQLMPPVMGAAAFLIAEFTGVPYVDILKHALLPALASYIALIYIVHLEATKLDLKQLKKPPSYLGPLTRLIGFLTGFLLVGLMFGAAYFSLAWVNSVAPALSFGSVVALCTAVYLALVWLAAGREDLHIDDPEAPILELPRAGPTALTGLYYLLPTVILIWCILPTPERLSPAYSVFWATMAMIVVSITHKPLKSLFRGSGDIGAAFNSGIGDLVAGMISGSRNMIGIAIATAAAGVIIGTVSLTGAHQVIGALIESISGGSLLFMLLLVAGMSLILGMGLPTTANYIVVSSLMAPVIVSLGAQSGLIVPLVAVHLFVFYFGILADDTPPVGLAAFAAAAISRGDPIRTGLQGFAYDIRTALLPFMFLFNTELLLIGVSVYKAALVFVVAVVAMMMFAAATQGYLLVRSRLWESALLLLVVFTLFRPGFWLDQVSPPYEHRPGAEVFTLAETTPADGQLRLRVAGPDINDLDDRFSTNLLLPLATETSGQDRLALSGLEVHVTGTEAVLAEPGPGTAFADLARQLDFHADEPVVVEAVLVARQRIAKEIFYLPAALLLALVIGSQLRRRRQGA